MTSFRNLVSRDWWDNHIVTCGVKTKNHLVEFTATLFRSLLGSEERNSQWECVSVCGLCLNELGEMVGFITANPKSHTATIVVCVNHINCGGHAILAFNTFIVGFNDVAVVKSIKLGLNLIPCWEYRIGLCGLLFCGFGQKCFNFTVFLAHNFHFLFFVASVGCNSSLSEALNKGSQG
tara:strand:+ start:73 stop:606 length:534 start_codon:yes stop_codon:yes gene_type:complete